MKNDDSIRKQRVKAVELLDDAGTRLYRSWSISRTLTTAMLTNRSIRLSPPVRQSNLCLEIALPTKPLNDVNDENGEIALCTLSASTSRH